VIETNHPSEFRNKVRSSRRLGDQLVADDVLEPEALQKALAYQAQHGGLIGEILVNQGDIGIGVLRDYLEEATGFPFIELTDLEIDSDVAKLLPESFVVTHRVLPFRSLNGQVHVAMADPLNLTVSDELKDRIDRRVVIYLAFSKDLDAAILRAFDVRQRARTALSEINPTPEVETAAANDDGPIVRLVNGLLSGAIANRASDVHLEPQGSFVRVRYRIDGMLYEQMTIPSNHLAACVSRLKVMADLDISERRRSQDGRFSTRDDVGNEFDVRLSLVPTVYGEKACMRLLEKTNRLASLDALGFFPDQLKTFERLIRRPYGLVLVTGPTGAGKSTTLYGALERINDPGVNINTVEDPVEYRLPGINQIQVNPKIGVTFASELRSLVRQDPDVILVGEIRDRETAEVAIQAALTGHLVLSTLHTNDAPSSVARLQNMGIEPFLITSSLIGVVAQRLMRTLCPHCREAFVVDEEEARLTGVPAGSRLYRSAGCRRCQERGTQGRLGAMEVMPVGDGLRSLMLDGAPSPDLRAKARAEGMMTMRESALQRAFEGGVSAKEIVRVFAE